MDLIKLVLNTILSSRNEMTQSPSRPQHSDSNVVHDRNKSEFALTESEIQECQNGLPVLLDLFHSSEEEVSLSPTFSNGSCSYKIIERWMISFSTCKNDDMELEEEDDEVNEISQADSLKFAIFDIPFNNNKAVEKFGFRVFCMDNYCNHSSVNHDKDMLCLLNSSITNSFFLCKKVKIMKIGNGVLSIYLYYNSISKVKRIKSSSPMPSPRIISKAVSIAELKLNRASFPQKKEEEDCKESFSRNESIRKKRIGKSYSFGEENDKTSLNGLKRAESFSCEQGNELFGSFVANYEESIITGRMSTLPSKPIEFSAEIGVVGKYKKCPSGLRSPSHIFVSFSAFYYELPGEDQPTPYVGLLDVPASFVLPLKGQLQILIRNMNNTVIKVFILSFDLRDMPSLSKTFLRQKSCILLKKEGTKANQSVASPERKLKHAIHVTFQRIGNTLTIQSPLRVVFSTNLMDEKLQLFVEGPDNPKYTMMLNDLEGATIR